MATRVGRIAAGSTTTGTSVSVAVTAATASGQAIIVVAGHYTGVPTLSDSRGNVYTKAVLIAGVSLWYSLTPTPLTTADTITLGGLGSNGGGLLADAWTGLTALDKTATGQNSNVAAVTTAATATTTQADEVLIGGIFAIGQPAGTTFTPGTNYTAEPGITWARTYVQLLVSEDRTVAATGAYVANGTLSATPGEWDAVLATFKVTAGLNVTLAATAAGAATAGAGGAGMNASSRLVAAGAGAATAGAGPAVLLVKAAIAAGLASASAAVGGVTYRGAGALPASAAASASALVGLAGLTGEAWLPVGIAGASAAVGPGLLGISSLLLLPPAGANAAAVAPLLLGQARDLAGWLAADPRLSGTLGVTPGLRGQLGSVPRLAGRLEVTE